MMKHEFEGLIGEEVSQEAYDKIEDIYMNYPGFEEKQQIVDLYMQFGMLIIEDMLPRALAIKEREIKICALKHEIESYKKRATK